MFQDRWFCKELIFMEFDQIKELIAKGNERWITAFKLQDPEMFASIFSSDGSIFSENGDIITGRLEIQKRITPFIERSGPIKVLIETLNIFPTADLIYESGKYSYIFAEGNVSSGKYVVVWKKNDVGGLEIFRDIGLSE